MSKYAYSSGGAARFVSVAVCALGCFVLQSCKSTPSTAPHSDAPSAQYLLDAHNERIARLGNFYADGVIELRWKDDEGKHFEQGDVEFFVQRPDKCALEISKLGERLFWLGGSGPQYWLFDLRDADYRELHMFHAGRSAQGETPSGPQIDLQELLDACGLSQFRSVDTQVTFDEKQHAWAMSAIGVSGPMTVYVDTATDRLKRIELHDEDANVSVISTFQQNRFQPVYLNGHPFASDLQLASHIDIERMRAGDRIRLAMARMTDGTDEIDDRLFDFDHLVGVFAPQVVHDAAIAQESH